MRIIAFYIGINFAYIISDQLYCSIICLLNKERQGYFDMISTIE